MNSTILEGKWKEIKGEVQNLWGELSFDDVEKTKGNLKSIAGLIEQQFGQAKEEVAAKLHDLADRLGASKDEAADKTATVAADVKAKVESKVADVKAAAADKTEAVKNDIRDAKNAQTKKSTSNY